MSLLHDKINMGGTQISVSGNPDYEIVVIDNSHLEKAMYDNEEN